MHNLFILADFGGSQLADQLTIGLLVVIAGFFISLYIFRSIFNIPSFLRYQKAQIRLLEEIAKKQGVDDSKVQTIISESIGWDVPKETNTPSN